MTRSLLIAVLASFSLPLAAQTVSPGYAVGTWKGFRTAAVTHTFDDNTPNQVAVAVPIFNEFEFDATFFVVTNWGPNWTGFAQAAANGHEITSHTVTHPSLGTLTADQQRTELANSQATIKSRVPGAEVLTLAYPNCVRGSDAVVSQYYIAARVCSGQIVPRTPPDFLGISSIIVGSQGAVQTASGLNARADAAASAGGWAVFLYHALDGESGYSPTLSGEIRGHLQYLRENRGRFWVDTFGNVVRYIRERDAASVAEVSATADAIVVTITDTLDDAVYDVPVTIRRVLPTGWNAATVTQAGAPVSATVVDAGGVASVQFDAVPDGGTVVLTKSETTSSAPAPQTGGSHIVASQPNPFHGRTTLVYEVGTAGPVTVEVYDLLGRQLGTLVNATLSTGRHTVTWDASRYGAGTYTYRLLATDRADVQQVTLAH